MPSLADFETWLEEQFPENLQQLPAKLHQTLYEYVEALHHQLTLYGPPSIPLPPMPPMPTLADIEEHFPANPFKSHASSPPPPPPPAPATLLESSRALVRSSSAYVRAHPTPFIALGSTTLGVGVVSLAWRRGHLWLPVLGRRDPSRISAGGLRSVLVGPTGARREAVVILGADTALGRALSRHFSSLGFIVIGSVASPQASADFERHVYPSSQGYVKALVLDPLEPVHAIPSFLRALNSVLSLRWPLTSAGDPYARPHEVVQVAAVVNALSFLPPPTRRPSLAAGDAATSDPTKGLFNAGHLTDVLERHVTTPLCATKALVDALRSISDARAREAEPLTVLTLYSCVEAEEVKLARGCGLGEIEEQRRMISLAVRSGAESLRDDIMGAAAASSRGLRSGARQRRCRAVALEVGAVRPWGRVPSLVARGIHTAAPASRTEEPAATRGAKVTPVAAPDASGAGKLGASLAAAKDPFLAAVQAKSGSLVLAPSSRRLSAVYSLRVPLRDSPVLEQTLLLRALTAVGQPFLIVSHRVGGMVRWVALRAWPPWRDLLSAFGTQLHARRTGIWGRDPHAPAGSGRRSGPSGPGPASHTHSRAWAESQDARRRQQQQQQQQQRQSQHSSRRDEHTATSTAASSSPSSSADAPPLSPTSAIGKRGPASGSATNPSPALSAVGTLNSVGGVSTSSAGSHAGGAGAATTDSNGNTSSAAETMSSSGILSLSSAPSSSFGDVDSRRSDFGEDDFGESASHHHHHGGGAAAVSSGPASGRTSAGEEDTTATGPLGGGRHRRRGRSARMRVPTMDEVLIMGGEDGLASSYDERADSMAGGLDEDDDEEEGRSARPWLGGAASTGTAAAAASSSATERGMLSSSSSGLVEESASTPGASTHLGEQGVASSSLGQSWVAVDEDGGDAP